MEEFWKAARERLARLASWWQGLNLNQKVLVLGALLLVLAALTVTLASYGGKDYEPLFTNLAVEDAAAITAKLQELNIDYRLGDNGTTILVPPEQKYQIRLQLAGAGLPRGVAGLELFSTSNFGETETDKRVKFQMALQGELTRTIQSLSKVQYAKVNLALPEKSLFSENEILPTASVLIKTKPYQELSRKEVKAVVHLVASSVEGLKPENVTVVDADGNLLSAGLSEEEASSAAVELTAAQLAMKRNSEKELQYSLQSMLEQVVGKGKVLVRVSLDMNFDQAESKKETYGPGTYVRSEKLTEEASTSTEQGAAGVPGTPSNVPTYQEMGQQGSTSSSEKSEKIRNYEIDREEVSRRFAQGNIKRLTVSVMVDKELTAREKEDLVQAVAGACGYDEARGDVIAVVGTKFTTAAEEYETPTTVGWLSQYGWLLGLVLALLVLAGLWIGLRRRVEAEKEEGLDVLVADEIKVEDLLDRELTPEEKEKKRIKEEIEKLVDNDPISAAQIIRTWLAEDAR